MPHSTVFVGNLDSEVSYEELRRLFNYFGDVYHLTIIRKKSIAFVKMGNQNDAERAILGLKNVEIRGHPSRDGVSGELHRSHARP